MILIIWVGSGCLFGASLVGDVWVAGAAYLKKRDKKKVNDKQRKAIVAHLDNLSEKENYEAAKALRGSSPSFESWAHSTGAGQLIAKGLVYSPQGTYNGDYFPFTFYDFAWDALLERKEEILKKEEAYELKRKKRR